jgi:hypothetical protein
MSHIRALSISTRHLPSESVSKHSCSPAVGCDIVLMACYKGQSDLRSLDKNGIIDGTLPVASSSACSLLRALSCPSPYAMGIEMPRSPSRQYTMSSSSVVMRFPTHRILSDALNGAKNSCAVLRVGCRCGRVRAGRATFCRLCAVLRTRRNRLTLARSALGASILE